MQVTFSDRLAKPIGPFSPAVRSNSQGYIYVSGQIGQSAETGKLVDGGIERQTEQVFANLVLHIQCVSQTNSIPPLGTKKRIVVRLPPVGLIISMPPFGRKTSEPVVSQLLHFLAGG
jgi:hypothetical protein